MLQAVAFFLLSGAFVLGVQVLRRQRGAQCHALFWQWGQLPGTAKQTATFTCQPADLIAQIDPELAEVNSYVIDPLERVPDQPFGHLHLGWINLLSQLEAGDTLWQFHSPQRANRCACSGFAVVHKRQVIAEFIYERHPQ